MDNPITFPTTPEAFNAYQEQLIGRKQSEKEAIKAHAEARGESVNGFVNRAIAETMERDNGAPAGPETEKPQA